MRLEVQALETGYGKAQVLFGVDLEVEAGELVALLGANGAGKTTLLRALSGLLRPWKGSVLLGGKDLRGLSPARRARLGLGHVPEGRQLFPLMTVEENLRLGAAFLAPGREKEGYERVYALFPRLAERRRQLAGTLSGGEQQMLAIGRALMQNPRILLMDEPSMGLAPVLVDFIFEIVQKLNQEGRTILLVEQNARLALQVAHRGYVLATGEIILYGPARELAENPEVQKAYLGEG